MKTRYFEKTLKQVNGRCKAPVAEKTAGCTGMPGISRIRPMSPMAWWLPPSSPTDTPAWEQQIFTLNLG